MFSYPVPEEEMFFFLLKPIFVSLRSILKLFSFDLCTCLLCSHLITPLLKEEFRALNGVWSPPHTAPALDRWGGQWIVSHMHSQSREDTQAMQGHRRATLGSRVTQPMWWEAGCVVTGGEDGSHMKIWFKHPTGRGRRGAYPARTELTA